MTMLIAHVLSTIPQPSADAPAGVKTAVGKMLGVVMYLSIAAAVAMFVAAGIWAWSGNNGHGSGISPALQSKIVSACIALALIGSASGIANFFL